MLRLTLGLKPAGGSDPRRSRMFGISAAVVLRRTNDDDMTVVVAVVFTQCLSA